MFDKVLTKVILILVVVLLLLMNLLGSEPIRAAATGTPPAIDGRLDDPVWQSALVLADFKTARPDFGKAPTEKTGAYLPLLTGQTVCTAFDVSDPLKPSFIAQIPLGELTLPSGKLRNKKSINLVYVRPGARSQTA